MPKPNIDVAIAILMNNNKILVGWREEHQHQGNKHEFPGGKVEVGEAPLHACRREILEEVGVDLEKWQALDFIQHEYDDVIVSLHFFASHVDDHLLEKIRAPWVWIPRHELQDLNFPKANASIVKRLMWPTQIKISSTVTDVVKLEMGQLLYLRYEPSEQELQDLASLSVEVLSKLILNIDVWKQLNPLQQSAVAVVHVKQSQLYDLKASDLCIGQRYLAACHNIEALQYAEKIGCEAAFLSPVFATQTHPEVEGLGWSNFAQMAKTSHLLIYALGGIAPSDYQDALTHYAYGVAGISKF